MPSEIALTTEQSLPTPQSLPQHQAADHCMFHLLGDIAHPVSTFTIRHVSLKPGWRNDIAQPIAAQESPFKPPRA